MKINQKRMFPLIMVLQIFIISFAVMAIPAAAVPDMPTPMKGSVELNGELAPVGTEISVELNGEEIAKVDVIIKGEYNSLSVVDLSEVYPNSKFYVNGIEAKLVDATVLENAVPAKVLVVDLTATSPDDGGTVNNGGSNSNIVKTTTSTSEEENPSGFTASTADDTSLKSVATTQSTELIEEEAAPASETGSSIMILVIGAIILIGIIVTVRYKLKEN